MVANAQMWGALFWLAIAMFVTWSGKDLGLGKTAEPGSGFALFWIGLIMCVLAASVLVQAILKGGENIATLWVGTRWPKVLLVVVMLLVFGFYFEPLGFVICAIGLLMVLMRDVDPLDRRVLPSVALLAVALAIDFAHMFPWTARYFFQMPSLPMGIELGAMHLIVAAVALLLINLRHADPVRWSLALPVIFGSAIGVWYVLNKLLRIQLPNGVLTPWLG